MSIHRRTVRRPPTGKNASPTAHTRPPRRRLPRLSFAGAGPVIRLPAGRFRPPHCPNRKCLFYRPRPDWSFSRWGFYHAPSCSRPLPRYRCTHCRRTFTARTFAVTYWLQRFDLLATIADLSVAGSGVRPIARQLGVAHSTVARHLTRAGRHCLLFHRHMLQGAVIREPIVFDGFETFEYSQFFPCHFNLAVGQESWFLYHFTDSPLRRKGSMTPKQKWRRAVLEAGLGRPDPKAVEDGIVRLLAPLLPLASRVADSAATYEAGSKIPVLLVHSDEHPAYVRAVRRLRRMPGIPRFRHQQTPSTDPRTRANALFPVNLADLLLRHCSADHRRETIAFDKRRQGGLERLAIFTVWRNTIKARRERRPGSTAAMAAGILARPLSWTRVFARRLFPRKNLLPDPWGSYYWRRVKTQALGERQTENRAVFAY